MNKLSYKTLKDMNYEGYLLENAPEKVLQFGEGNFLRAFVDYFFDVANEKCGFNGKIVLCQPIEPGLADMINEQEGLYTLYLRGFENGSERDFHPGKQSRFVFQILYATARRYLIYLRLIEKKIDAAELEFNRLQKNRELLELM